MFIGHWAPALAVAAKRPAPTLGVLMIAGQVIDWAFFTFHLAGIEHMRFTPGISTMNPMDLYHMPCSHSLLGACLFGLLLAVYVWLGTKDRTAALLAAAVVVSHWFIDLLVHVPDLTITGSPPKLGLGLWNHPLIEMPLELFITFGALWLYARARQPASARFVDFRGPVAGAAGVQLVRSASASGYRIEQRHGDNRLWPRHPGGSVDGEKRARFCLIALASPACGRYAPAHVRDHRRRRRPARAVRG